MTRRLLITTLQVENTEEQGGGQVEEDAGGGHTVLYIGLGLVAVGLVISCVGLGEKGFLTVELQVVGPGLVVGGVGLAIARVLCCTIQYQQIHQRVLRL